MRFASPHEPSPEEEIIAQAVVELLRRKEVDQFYICVNTVIRGVLEPDVLVARLVELGVSRTLLTVEPQADTTDGELEVFQKFLADKSDAQPSALAIEAKRGRLEKIQARIGLQPTTYWAEDVLAGSPHAALRERCARWRASLRHANLRIRLGLLPLFVMVVDPQARLAQWLARILRHQG